MSPVPPSPADPPTGCPLPGLTTPGPTPADRPEESENTPHVQRLVHELRVHQAELEAQNEELRQAQGQLAGAREYLLQLFQAAPVGYVVLDSLGLVLEANDTFERLLGPPGNAVRGVALDRHMVGSSGDEFRARYGAFYRRPGDRSLELWFARAAGEPFLGRLVAASRRIEHAAAADREALLVVVLDVTAERQAETATRAHTRQLRSLLDFSTRSFATAIEAGQSALAESLKVTGSRSGVLHLLDGAGRAPSMSAWQRTAPAGKGLAATVAAGLSGIWLQAIRDGQPVWSDDPDGSGSPALWPEVGPPSQRLLAVAAGDRACPVAVIGLADAPAPFSRTDADGVQLLMARLREIIDRLAIEARITDQRARSFHADRMRTLGEMATGMAHEINQPLNGIRVFAEGLLVGLRRGWPVVETELTEALRDIVRLVDRASGTIDHVRALAADRDDQPPVPFALAPVVNRAVALARGQMHAAGIAVDCQATGELPLACGWPGAIEQVVLILLDNARDAVVERQQRRQAGPGEWVPQILVRVAVDGGNLVLTVMDNGDGVPEPVRARIFDPFFTTKEVGKGTGLGLATARSIVERHGGVIQLTSPAEGGAVFRVALPVRGAAG